MNLIHFSPQSGEYLCFCLHLLNLFVVCNKVRSKLHFYWFSIVFAVFYRVRQPICGCCCWPVQQNKQAQPRCLSAPCYWTAAPVVTRGVEPTQLNGKHVDVLSSCLRINPPQAKSANRPEGDCRTNPPPSPSLKSVPNCSFGRSLEKTRLRRPSCPPLRRRKMRGFAMKLI